MGCYRNNNVAGASDYRRHCNDVAGIYDDDFRVPVYSYIDSEDFCRAVHRCLDKFEDEENSRRDNRCKCKKCRRY